MALEKEVNDMYTADLESYSASTLQPRSACEYYEAINDAPTTLILFTDAVAQWFGMSVTIMMVSPMNDRKIMVRR